MSYDYDYFRAGADYLKKKIGYEPEIAVILGSCLGPFASRIEHPIEIDYRDIPNFLISTVESHAGKLIFGEVQGKKIVCMSGRFHTYEGYEFEELVIPVRVLKLLGVKQLILTNASGGVNEDYRCGDIMIIKDHIKLNGPSPLRGKNVEEFGPRFFDVTDMYSEKLRKLALRCAETADVRVHEGVYFFMPGPQFETPAEIRAIRILGGDAVGMSTVTEALTAAHCGLPVLGLAVITNMGAGILQQKLSDQEVGDTARMIAENFSRYMENIINAIEN